MDAPKCIINADDFGLNSNVNFAVIRSFEMGWVSSATIMANMPGFDEACQIVADNKLHHHVGIHLVLTEGTPLTEPIKRQRRFCDSDGRFYITRAKHLLYLTNIEKEAVAKELRAQIERCMKNGLQLSHIDSHHHIHEEIGIISLIIPLMNEFHISYIRIMSNIAKPCTISRRAYTILYNNFLRFTQLNKTEYFGSIEQYINSFKDYCTNFISAKYLEVMTHPTLNEKGEIIDSLCKQPMAKLVGACGLHWITCSFCDAVFVPRS